VVLLCIIIIKWQHYSKWYCCLLSLLNDNITANGIAVYQHYEMLTLQQLWYCLLTLLNANITAIVVLLHINTMKC
jgi:hypothetical protein